LETEHNNLLWFPFAKEFYTVDYILSVFLLGASYQNYFGYLLYKRGWFYKNKTITLRRVQFIRDQLNLPGVRNYLDNKVQFAKHWHSFFNRAFCSIQDPLCTQEVFVNLFKNCEKIIIKPLDSSGGKNIRVLDVNDNLPEIYEQLKNDPDNTIVEEYISQTGLLHTFNPSSLNTLQVVIIRDQSTVQVFYSLLRVGGKNSLVDNLHAGGVGFVVSPKTGRIHSGMSLDGKEHSNHPDNGIKIQGLSIPNWEKVRQFCIDAHKIAPEGLDYIGWDVCLCEDKLYMIEGNARPIASVCVGNMNLWGTICQYFDSHPEIPLYTKTEAKIMAKNCAALAFKQEQD